MVQSKLAKTISEAVGETVTDQQIMNDAGRAIGNERMANYHAGTDTVVGDDFTVIGRDLMENPNEVGDYLSSVAVKYANVFIKSQRASNPLYMFKRGALPVGGALETVVYDIIKPKLLKPYKIDGEDNPFAVNFGRVVGHTYTHEMRLESRNTISDIEDPIHFQNITQYHNHVLGKINQLVNGIILEEYLQTKMAVAKPLADGFIKKNDANTITNIKELQEAILYTARRMRYMTPDYNADGITQANKVDDLVVLIPLKASMNLDVNFLMNAFNAELMKNTRIRLIEVDSIPSVFEYTKDHVVTAEEVVSGDVDAREHPVGSTIPKGSLGKSGATDVEKVLDGDKVGAIVMDRDALQLWDRRKLTLTQLSNPAKGYTNINGLQVTKLMFVQSLNSKALMVDFDLGFKY